MILFFVCEKKEKNRSKPINSPEQRYDPIHHHHNTTTKALFTMGGKKAPKQEELTLSK
jgi:hypothetical protein